MLMQGACLRMQSKITLRMVHVTGLVNGKYTTLFEKQIKILLLGMHYIFCLFYYYNFIARIPFSFVSFSLWQPCRSFAPLTIAEKMFVSKNFTYAMIHVVFFGKIK